MEDNRKEKRDKYELWASLLEGQSVFSSENLSQADEELQKLSFLWNQCDPPQTDSGEIWEKTLRKIKAEEEAKNGYPGTFYMNLDTTKIKGLGWFPIRNFS